MPPIIPSTTPEVTLYFREPKKFLFIGGFPSPENDVLAEMRVVFVCFEIPEFQLTVISTLLLLTNRKYQKF